MGVCVSVYEFHTHRLAQRHHKIEEVFELALIHDAGYLLDQESPVDASGRHKRDVPKILDARILGSALEGGARFNTTNAMTPEMLRSGISFEAKSPSLPTPHRGICRR